MGRIGWNRRLAVDRSIDLGRQAGGQAVTRTDGGTHRSSVRAGAAAAGALLALAVAAAVAVGDGDDAMMVRCCL